VRRTELYLFGLIGMARQPDKQKNRIIGYLFENRFHWWFEISSVTVYSKYLRLKWLRYCATNRKTSGLFPAGVIGIFQWHKILPIALWFWGRLSL